MSVTGTVYLIHFAHPLGNTANPHGMALHYIGYAKGYGLADRIEAHRKGNGAAIMTAVNKAGIPWEVVNTWPGDRKLERDLKRQHNAARYCPICREARATSAVIRNGNTQYVNGGKSDD